MSARALAWAWKQEPKTTSQKLVLAALADRADDEGECFPSVKWIAAKCAPMPERTVRRNITELAQQGLVTKAERKRRDDGTLSVWVYRLPVPPDEESPPATSGQWSPPATSGRTDLELADATPSVEADASTALEIVEQPETTQTLVAEIVDDARALDIPIPTRVRGQLAKNIKPLLDEGYTIEQVRAGVTRMMERRVVQPAMLANFVMEAALTAKKPNTKYGRRDVSGAELEALAERLEAEDRRELDTG